MTIKRLICQ